MEVLTWLILIGGFIGVFIAIKTFDEEEKFYYYFGLILASVAISLSINSIYMIFA